MEPAHISHIWRYKFAKDHAKGKKVLDIGCAAGEGTAVLAEVAKSVDSLDNDPSLIAAAKKDYAHLKNTTFAVGDARSLPFPDNSFDLAIAFEVIEHFKAQEQFLKELQRVVKSDGMIILSTPDHDSNMKIGVYQPKHEGHGHPGELTFPQLFYLMNRYFSQPRFYGQFFYDEPSFKDKLINQIKRADVLKLRKMIPRKSRDKHNFSVRVYEQDPGIHVLDRPAAQLLVVAINKK